ncbi:MAG: PrgI family protein, partial [Actinomycetota bacterium]
MKVRVPANVDMPDRIVAGLTIRQLAILALDGLVLWALFLAAGRALSPIALVAVSVPLAAAGLAAGASSPHGISLDRLVRLALRYLQSAKRRVLAPEGSQRASQ